MNTSLIEMLRAKTVKNNFDHKKTERLAGLLKHERERRANLSEDERLTVSMPTTTKAKIENLLGRPLSLTEQMSLTIKGRDLMSVRDRLQRNGWAPPMADQDANPIDAEITAAKDEIRQEKLNAMSPAERKLFHLEEAKRQEAERELAAIAERQRQEAMQPILDQLSEAFQFYADRIDRFDDRTLDAVAQAMIAIESGSPPDVIADLMADAVRDRSEYTGQVEKAIADRLADVKSELETFRKANGLTTGAETSEPEIIPPSEPVARESSPYDLYRDWRNQQPEYQQALANHKTSGSSLDAAILVNTQADLRKRYNAENQGGEK